MSHETIASIMGRISRQKRERYNEAQGEASSMPHRLSLADLIILLSNTSLAVAAFSIDSFGMFVACLGIACVSYCYLAWQHIRRVGYQVALCTIIVVVFAGISIYAFRRQREVATESIFDHLSVEMSPIDVSRPIQLLYALKNDSHFKVAHYKAVCELHALLSESGAGLVEGTGKIQTTETEGELNSGGGANTDGCDVSHLRFDLPPACIDLGIRARYEFPTNSGMWTTKNFRFVMASTTGPHWFPVSPETPGNVCQGVLKAIAANRGHSQQPIIDPQQVAPVRQQPHMR